MTVAYARARSFAHAVKIGAYRWLAQCSTCDTESKYCTSKGDATTLARRHNAQFHPEPRR